MCTSVFNHLRDELFKVRKDDLVLYLIAVYLFYIDSNSVRKKNWKNNKYEKKCPHTYILRY